MPSKLDIFAVLGYLDENNLGVYNALRDDPDMLKELDKNVGWMLPQWMTAANRDDYHAALVANFNEFCNPRWFQLYGHPELQAKLLACCGVGKTRHKYYKPAKSQSLSRMTELLSHKYGDIREDEVKLWVSRSSKAAMVRLAEALGYQKEQVKDLTKAFDALRKG